MPQDKNRETPADRVKGPIEGEGSYTATRGYQKSVRGFVGRNKDKIDKLAHDAEAALDGPEGPVLRKAEEAGRSGGRKKKG